MRKNLLAILLVCVLSTGPVLAGTPCERAKSDGTGEMITNPNVTEVYISPSENACYLISDGIKHNIDCSSLSSECLTINTHTKAPNAYKNLPNGCKLDFGSEFWGGDCECTQHGCRYFEFET